MSIWWSHPRARRLRRCSSGRAPRSQPCAHMGRKQREKTGARMLLRGQMAPRPRRFRRHRRRAPSPSKRTLLVVGDCSGLRKSASRAFLQANAGATRSSRFLRPVAHLGLQLTTTPRSLLDAGCAYHIQPRLHVARRGCGRVIFLVELPVATGQPGLGIVRTRPAGSPRRRRRLLYSSILPR